MTGNNPKLKLKLKVIDKRFTIDYITVDGEYASKKQSFGIVPSVDYQWFSGESSNGEYLVTFNYPLINSEKHDYFLHVHLKYQEGITERGGFIMTTGKVIYQEDLFTYVVSAIIGSALTLLIQWIVIQFAS